MSAFTIRCGSFTFVTDSSGDLIWNWNVSLGSSTYQMHVRSSSPWPCQLASTPVSGSKMHSACPGIVVLVVVDVSGVVVVVQVGWSGSYLGESGSQKSGAPAAAGSAAMAASATTASVIHRRFMSSPAPRSRRFLSLVGGQHGRPGIGSCRSDRQCQLLSSASACRTYLLW